MPRPNQTPLSDNQPEHLTAAILRRYEGAESWIGPADSVGPADLVVKDDVDVVYSSPLRGGERSGDVDTFRVARRQLAEAGFVAGKWAVVRHDGRFAGWTAACHTA